MAEFDVIIKDFELMIEGDMVLIEQVLINLIINAIDAVQHQPSTADLHIVMP